jgi:Peptidase family M1 domain
MLKQVLFYCCSVFLIPVAIAQKKYWQQQVNFTIDVKLNDVDHSLDAFENIEYINNSPDTLSFIWFHVWMNAYKNDKTAFSEQLLTNNDTKFYFSSDKDKGYTNRLNFQVANKTLKVEDHPNYIDIVKVILDEPLLPGQKINITTPFHVKLPFNFSRGGHVNQSYQITQWYPKPAVYDAQGWHEMPYVDQGEFYSNFGNYNVSISLPTNYKVAATGELQNDEEKQWLKENSTVVYPTPQKAIVKNSNNSTAKKAVYVPKIPSSSTFKTITYKQDNVVDFAWFADKEFTVKQDTLLLPNNKIVSCYNFYRLKNEAVWAKGLKFVKRALIFRSEVIGVYPFATATIVDAPMGFSGGMEYPTITSITGSGDEQSLDLVVEHELGHNWFQGILANNERAYPWLDEGLNSYYDKLYEQKYYPVTPTKKKPIKIPSVNNLDILKVLTTIKKDQPINTSSVTMYQANYGFVTYEKTAQWLTLIEKRIGKDAMDTSMKQYYEQWKFKHLTPTNFDSIFNKYPSYKDSLSELKNKTGELVKLKSKKSFTFLPVLGLNKYDGFMLGAGVHNYMTTTSKIRFAVAPLYGFASKLINSLARVAYNIYPEHHFERVDIGVSGSKFSNFVFKDERVNLNLGYFKIVPFIRFTLKEKTATSQRIRNFQFKHFNITEDNLQFTRIDNAPIDTFFLASTAKGNYYLNQFQFNYKRASALYPYNLQVQIEQTKDLLRSTIMADEYFNYNGKGEGLTVRLFAGKISYLGAKTNIKRFANDRYALNLLSPKGSEDYTYSTYFYGRNEFDKGSSKQILSRDGFFKFRTDQLANKPGRTDNWLASANFVSDIPSQLNPLSILPIKIPIRLFADLGTYAEAWQKNSGDTKFLFNAGLQLSLLKGTIEIYLPLVYSKPFSDYSLQTYGKKRSLKNISFAVNLNNFTLRKFVPQLTF